MLSAPHKRAFSLIELLIVVSIMLLLFSGALAAYIRYTEKQRIISAAETLEALIKEAQSRAKTGYIKYEEDKFCSELFAHGVEVWIENGLINYQQLVICQDQLETYFTTSGFLADGLTISQAFQIEFLPYAGALIKELPSETNVNNLSIELSSTRRPDYVVTFTFDRGGGIKVQY